MTIIMACKRCSNTERIESHHIIQRLHGGSDEPVNREKLCQGCHDYEHAKRYIQERLDIEIKRGDKPRIVVYEHRLAVNEKLNTPELIRERGYKNYWSDNTTHLLPRQNLTQKEAELEGQISLWVKTGQVREANKEGGKS